LLSDAIRNLFQLLVVFPDEREERSERGVSSLLASMVLELVEDARVAAGHDRCDEQPERAEHVCGMHSVHQFGERCLPERDTQSMHRFLLAHRDLRPGVTSSVT